MNTSLFTVPISVEATSREELTRKMLAIQARLRLKIHFFDIQKDGKKWVAWYEVDLKSQLVRGEDGTTE